jgi:hypothetical protein
MKRNYPVLMVDRNIFYDEPEIPEEELDQIIEEC